MNFLDRALAATILPFTPATYNDEFLMRLQIARGGSGTVAVTPETVMSLPVAYACTRVVSEDIAKVPLQVFRDNGDDGKALQRDHEWYDTLHHQANEYQSAIEFREMMTAFALNRGRGLAEKRTRRVAGAVRRDLVPLHPDLVTPEVTDAGRLRYRYRDPVAKRERNILPDEVLAVRGFNGLGVIEVARRSFELMLQMQNYATETYRKGPRHTGVVQRPKDAPRWNDTNREVFRKSIDEYQSGGDRAGRPLLLEDGMTWTNASFTLADAEFLGTMQHTVADGCRWYRVPQHKVQELMRSTNNNIEQQSIDYVTDSLLAWAVRWEQAIRRDLMDDGDDFAEHNLDGLMRGDPKARAEAYGILVNTGIMTPDEARKKENMNPRGGPADELRTPLNMSVGSNVPGTSVAELPDGRVRAQLRAILHDQAARAFRKEIGALGKLARDTGGSGDEWRAGVRAFYREHAEFVARSLRVDDELAEAYCAARCSTILEQGPAAIEDPETGAVAVLTDQALERADPLQLPEGAVA